MLTVVVCDQLVLGYLRTFYGLQRLFAIEQDERLLLKANWKGQWKPSTACFNVLSRY